MFQKRLIKMDLTVYSFQIKKKINWSNNRSDIRKNLLKNVRYKQKSNINCSKKFLKIPTSKVEKSNEILLKSNKMLLPIVEKGKLIDFVHTRDLFREKK